jgi:ubiquinone/menaquinone biosynthesis C-methylase UbiE
MALKSSLKQKAKPETLENRWDILYRDYPEVYDEFASVKKKPGIEIAKMFDFKNKIVVDVGAGTGLSTFPRAKYVKEIIGIEPELAMIKIAKSELKKKKLKNVSFKVGTSSHIPLKDNFADIVFAVTSASFYNAKSIKDFVNESTRVLKNQGLIISVDIAPKWYGGELAPVIYGKSRMSKGIDSEEIRNTTFTKLGFKHKDVLQNQEYGSLKKIVSTYGFIFGKKAIEYLKKHNKTNIRWKIRVYYKYINKK